MRIAEIVGIAVVLGGMSYVISESQDKSSILEGQLDIAMGFQTQLQTQAENYAQQRAQFEEQLSNMQSQLISASTQLANLSAELQAAREQAHPDYAQMLEQAQTQVAQESGRQRRINSSSPLSSPLSSPFSDPDVAQSWAADSVPALYSDYINALGIATVEQEEVMDAMIDFASQRYQMLGELMEGSLSTDQALAMFGPDAIENGMGAILSDEQLDELSQYDLLIKQDTAREIYGQSLTRSGTAISGSIHDQVIDAVVNELFSAENNYAALVAEDGSMISAHQSQVEAYGRARENLQGELNQEQLNQYDQFVNNQNNGVDIILESSTDDNGRNQVRRVRIDAGNLPN